MTQISFEGQVAIVTGAGGGLGRSYALELARRGASVVVNDIGGAKDGSGDSRSPADAVVEEIEGFGGRAVANYASVATAEGGADIVDTAVRKFGGVHILINNAGIIRNRTFLKLQADELRPVIDVHLLGAFHVSQPAATVMRQNGYGRLVFTGSAAGLWGNVSQANYGAAKMGLVGLSNVLAIEGARYGIQSNVICPIAASRLTDGLMGPLGDKADPDLVTPLVMYLVSSECELTHEVFSVGTGHFARVFTAVTPGWQSAPGQIPTPEDVRAQLPSIMRLDGFHVPMSVPEEMELVLQAHR